MSDCFSEKIFWKHTLCSFISRLMIMLTVLQYEHKYIRYKKLLYSIVQKFLNEASFKTSLTKAAFIFNLFSKKERKNKVTFSPRVAIFWANSQCFQVDWKCLGWGCHDLHRPTGSQRRATWMCQKQWRLKNVSLFHTGKLLMQRSHSVMTAKTAELSACFLWDLKRFWRPSPEKPCKCHTLWLRACTVTL